MTGHEGDPLSLLGVDMQRPCAARMYDYWLGGSHNFASDRELGDRMCRLLPSVRDGVWSDRAFMRRVMRFLAADCGVTQFLDLGSGIPTAGNVHEIAQRVSPEARVVYVDSDPIVVSHSQHILAGTDGCAMIRADFREPDQVFGAPEFRRLIDLDRPLAVSFVAALGFLTDADDPRGLVRRYLAPLMAGSYLVVSHGAADPIAPAAQTAALLEYQTATGVRLATRGPEQLRGLFDEFELCEPGVVLVDQWRPDSHGFENAMPFYGGVARKPAH